MAFQRLGLPRGSEIILPSAIVCSATPHQKGNYTQIDASTAREVGGILLRTNDGINANGLDTSMLIDIAVGGAGVEQVVVPDIPVGGNTGDIQHWLPIHIPQGVRIAARAQGVIASDQYTNPQFCLIFADRIAAYRGWQGSDAIGVNTATSGPTTGDLTDNAFDEITSSTARDYRAITFYPTVVPGLPVGFSGSTFTVDLGVGGAGSEQVLNTWRVTTTNSEGTGPVHGIPFIEQEIPAGSRLALRKNGTAECAGALMGWY